MLKSSVYLVLDENQISLCQRKNMYELHFSQFCKTKLALKTGNRSYSIVICPSELMHHHSKIGLAAGLCLLCLNCSLPSCLFC